MSEGKSRFASAGLWLGVIALALLVLSILGNRLEVIHFGIAVRGMALAALVGIVAVIVSAAGVVLTFMTKRTGLRTAIAGLVLGVLVSAPVVQSIMVGAKVPRIHDITTDLDNPPAFEAAVAARGENSNSLDRASPDLAELQRQAYPDLETLHVSAHPGKVFEAALETAKEQGWEILAADPARGTIEAVAVTRVMNFKDDVAIRIAETADGAAVDMRSVSRVGESDLGANANRIRTFRDALKAKLAEAG